VSTAEPAMRSGVSLEVVPLHVGAASVRRSRRWLRIREIIQHRQRDKGCDRAPATGTKRSGDPSSLTSLPT
jgi:hypothetical protein